MEDPNPKVVGSNRVEVDLLFFGTDLKSSIIRNYYFLGYFAANPLFDKKLRKGGGRLDIHILLILILCAF